MKNMNRIAILTIFFSALLLFSCRPGSPKIIQPEHGAVITDEKVRIEWTEKGQVGGYMLEIAADAGFSDIAHAEMTGDSPSSVRLQPGYYYCRVCQTSGGEQCSDWSDVIEFRYLYTDDPEAEPTGPIPEDEPLTPDMSEDSSPDLLVNDVSDPFEDIPLEPNDFVVRDSVNDNDFEFAHSILEDMEALDFSIWSPCDELYRESDGRLNGYFFNGGIVFFERMGVWREDEEGYPEYNAVRGLLLTDPGYSVMGRLHCGLSLEDLRTLLEDSPEGRPYHFIEAEGSPLPLWIIPGEPDSIYRYTTGIHTAHFYVQDGIVTAIYQYYDGK
jgi:hypothetical protein